MQKTIHLTDQEAWLFRMYLWCGGTLYPLWVPLEIYVNHNNVYLWERLTIASLFFLMSTLSYKVSWFKKNLELLSFLSFLLMIGQYFVEIYRNQANSASIEGFHIITVASLLTIRNLRYLAIYWFYIFCAILITYRFIENPVLKEFHLIAAYSTVCVANFVLIAARHRMEEKLRREHQNFQMLFDKNIEGLALINSAKKMIQFNSLFLKMFPETTSGKPIHELFPFDGESEKEFLFHHPVQKERIYRLRSMPIEFENEKMFVLSISDMTQRKKEEASLLNSSKMSALGEMASGIAHEVNNPLTVIRGNTMMMKYLTKNLPEREKIEQILDTNLSSIDKAARIIWGLQRFAKDGSKDPYEKKNLLELIQDVVAFSEARMKNEGIHFDLKIPETIEIECQVIQLQQVFLNLINNSIYELQHGDHRRKVIRIEASISENEILITLTDSGRGIPEELQSKLMQPFFTTKPFGEGAGLGLSTSRGIMESHHGKLSLNPSYKEGAQFHIRLPLMKKAA